MTETALEKAQRKFEQAKAALDAVKAREAAAERKKDTRRKIVLGGALLELAKTDRETSALVTRLIAGLSRDHDKTLFEKMERGSAKESEGKHATPEPVTASAPPPIIEPKAQPRSEQNPRLVSSGYGTFQIKPDSDEI